ncbi:HrpE/YscL family type III secretion apparatus protein [Roseobacter weihaiensis]|uniref:HrpE/YscL family type III secretion apparatus protein n=1 Tax=Roseobacter weihaiensis TaxID=2763262 RepID=UPI001D0A8E77|nr:HrpE/YscL family type III secretion apparatus protein [Roseobacter sp. H9]
MSGAFAADRAALGVELAARGPCLLSSDEVAHHRSAARMLDRAERMARRWEAGGRAAFRQARREGHQQGLDQAAETIAGTLRDFEIEISRLRAAYTASIGDILSAALAHFIGAAPSTDLLAQSVHHALDGLAPGSVVGVFAAPGDLVAVSETIDGNAVKIQIAPDASLAEGTVAIRTASGEIRVSLSAHVAAIKALADEVQQDMLP